MPRNDVSKGFLPNPITIPSILTIINSDNKLMIISRLVLFLIYDLVFGYLNNIYVAIDKTNQ